MRSRRIGSVMAGIRPKRVSGRPKVERSVATTRSQAAASPTPPASVSPSTAATTGFPHERMSHTHCTKASTLRAHSISSAPASSAASRAVKSMPRQNYPVGAGENDHAVRLCDRLLDAVRQLARRSGVEGGRHLNPADRHVCHRAAGSAPGITAVIVAHPAEDQVSLSPVVTVVPALQPVQAGLVLPAVDIPGPLTLDRLVLFHADRMALVEQVRQPSGTDHLTSRRSDEAAVKLRAAAGPIGVEADTVPWTEVLGPVDETHEADQRARRVRPAHSPYIAERGERLPLEVRPRLALRERLPFPEHGLVRSERHATEGRVVDVFDEVGVEVDRLADALDVVDVSAVQRVEICEETRFGVALLDPRGRTGQIRDFLRPVPALVDLDLQQTGVGRYQNGRRAGAHHELVGLTQVHAALIRRDDQRFRGPGQSRRDPGERHLQPGRPAVAGVLDLEVPAGGLQPEVAVDPGARCFLLVGSALRADDKEFDRLAVRVGQHGLRRIDGHRDGVFPGRIDRALVDHHGVVELDRIVTADGAELLDVQDEAARVGADLLDAGPPRRPGHGAQSSPPVTPIAWPLMKLAASDARNITALETSPSSPTRPTGQYWSQKLRFDSDIPSRVMSVSKNPATTTLLVMPLRPYSLASAAERPSSPALLAA